MHGHSGRTWQAKYEKLIYYRNKFFKTKVLNLKGQDHFVTSWLQKKRAWKIIMYMKIAIAFDYIYQEIKGYEDLKLVGNATT